MSRCILLSYKLNAFHVRETEMTREREELNRAQQREKEWDERHWAVEMGRLKI